jgi:hypothetical protein
MGEKCRYQAFVLDIATVVFGGLVFRIVEHIHNTKEKNLIRGE